MPCLVLWRNMGEPGRAHPILVNLDHQTIAIGKNLSTERQSTIGEQRRTNYACQPMSVEEKLDCCIDQLSRAGGHELINGASDDRATADGNGKLGRKLLDHGLTL